MAQTRKFRIVRVDEPGFPGFYRVVWRAHVVEFSDLSRPDRLECMDAVAGLEEALRRHLQPDKVNLAALGNQVPHLHWHVIARYRWDSHFPAPVWAVERRTVPSELQDAVLRALPDLEQELTEALRQWPERPGHW